MHVLTLLTLFHLPARIRFANGLEELLFSKDLSPL